MSRISIDNWTDRLMYLQCEAHYPECNMMSLTQDDIIGLKIGAPCYITSGSGLNFAMFVGMYKNLKTKEPELEFYIYTGHIKYKVMNLGKTYNVYKAILD